MRDQRCDEVAAWHESAEDGELLHERLGMSWGEYCEWAGPYRLAPSEVSIGVRDSSPWG